MFKLVPIGVSLETKVYIILSFQQLTTRLNQSIPKMLPVISEKLQQLQARQRRLQELKPKIDEVSFIATCFL